MNRLKLIPACLLCMAAVLPVFAVAAPETLKNRFTYQGELTDGGAPANGAYDFEFKMFDAAMGGAQIGITMTADDVNVAGGRFAAVLDPNVYLDGTRAFLEIGVRPGASGGAYTTLTPRQELTATPYALTVRPGAVINDPEGYEPWLLKLSTDPAALGPPTLVQIDAGSGRAINANAQTDVAIWGTYNGNGLSPGVLGQSTSASVDATGVTGGVTNTGSDPTSAGMRGINKGAGMGVYGEHESATGTAAGVKGVTQSASGYAVGVQGEVATTAAGGYSAGIRGVNNSTNGNGIGVYGTQAGTGYGVYGETPGGRGVYGFSPTGTGVFSRSHSGYVFQGYNQFDVVFQVDSNGDVSADGTYTSPAADFAELLPARGETEPGDVLSVGADGNLTRSAKAYDPAVAGVHSTRPAFLGGAGGEDDASKIPLGVVGVVPVKVTDENGPIAPGDLLVASSVPGHAMRAGDDPPNGTVIGKALQRSSGGRGVIRAILMLQ